MEKKKWRGIGGRGARTSLVWGDGAAARALMNRRKKERKKKIDVGSWAESRAQRIRAEHSTSTMGSSSGGSGEVLVFEVAVLKRKVGLFSLHAQRVGEGVQDTEGKHRGRRHTCDHEFS